VGDHSQADRRRQPQGNGERLLQHRVPRVEPGTRNTPRSAATPRLFQNVAANFTCSL
jgi:hypothetical protein